MQILMINNDGGGFADHMDISEGTTIAQLFADKLPSRTTEDYLIRVNRQPIPREYILQDGDRVTITPRWAWSC